MIFIYLFIATIAIFIGAAIAFIARGKTGLFAIIFGFTAGAVLGVPFLLITHLYEELGIASILVMLIGFLLIFLIDRLTHQHPKPDLKNRLWVADLTLVGLSIHALADGFNLVVATTTEDAQLGAGLAFAILVHRLPVAIILTLAFLRRNNSLIATLGRLTPLMIAPLIGALIGESLLRGAFGEFTEYLTAFAAGTLLHVLIDDFRGNYTPLPDRFGKFAGGIAFAIGLVVIFLVSHNINLWH